LTNRIREKRNTQEENPKLRQGRENAEKYKTSQIFLYVGENKNKKTHKVPCLNFVKKKKKKKKKKLPT